MKTTLNEFISISQSIGSQVDYVQGGGGNTSVKLTSSLMAIKASGIRLLDMTNLSGYTLVNYPGIEEKLCTSLSEEDSTALILNHVEKHDGFSSGRPSMEAGFHAILGKFVIHTHSVYSNIITCAENGEALLKGIFLNSSNKPVWIPYHNPGLQLTLAIKNSLEIHPETNIFFLQNHGIIVSGENAEQTLSLHQNINKRIISHFNLPKLSQDIILKQEKESVYTLEGKFRRDLAYVKNHVIFPDQTIYLSCDFDIQPNQALFYADLKKAQFMAETFLAYEYILNQLSCLNLQPHYIENENIARVSAMPNETYRKGLLK
ncbi:MAG: class II aldolase [bacterium]|nr:class II aldolase [bacterium]